MITRIKVTLKNGKTRSLNLGIKNIDKIDKNRNLFIQMEDGSSVTDVKSDGRLTVENELCIDFIDSSLSFCIPVSKIFGWCYAD